MASSKIITVTVSGGSGTATEELRGRGLFVTAKSPDDTLLYNLEILDEDDHLCLFARDVDAQRAKIETHYQMNGTCTFNITGAADDGDYAIKVPIR